MFIRSGGLTIQFFNACVVCIEVFPEAVRFDSLRLGRAHAHGSPPLSPPQMTRELLVRYGDSARIVAAVRSPSTSTSLLDLAASNPTLSLAPLDVTAPDSIAALPEVLRSQGVDHVGVLINNAGIYGHRKNLGEFQQEDFYAPFQINAVGPLLLVQELHTAQMLGGTDRQSLVVNISSMVASMQLNTWGGGYAYRVGSGPLVYALSCLNRERGRASSSAGEQGRP